MKERKAKPYHITETDLTSGYKLDGRSIYIVPDYDLERWAADPDCIERELCAVALSERRAKLEREEADLIAERAAKLAAKREELRDNPFDHRTEVSADAIHIVKHLWIIFVLLPFVIALLLVILGVNR